MARGNDPRKPLALIVDLDETICTQFDVPVEAGVMVLRRVDHLKVQVHYVTARPVVEHEGSEKFLETHRLPGSRNVYCCPDSVTSNEHKRRLHESLNREFEVIASIGDSPDEAQASAAAGIHFVQVDPNDPADAWSVLAARIAQFGGFCEP